MRAFKVFNSQKRHEGEDSSVSPISLVRAFQNIRVKRSVRLVFAATQPRIRQTFWLWLKLLDWRWLKLLDWRWLKLLGWRWLEFLDWRWLKLLGWLEIVVLGLAEFAHIINYNI
jgi:hypothetical protein